jgi:hypothetical protein
VSNIKVSESEELGRVVSKEVDVAYFKALSQNFPGGAE